MSQSAPTPAATGAGPNAERARSNAARLSVGVAGTLLSLKLGVALWTGSLAIVASTLDSMLDLFASVVNWLVIRAAESPPDREHPYGHGKAEYLGGLFQGGVIGASGLFVLREAIGRLRTPVTVEHTSAGIVLMFVSLIATAWLVARLRAAARETESPALRADSVHYMTDIYANAGALLALLIVAFTGKQLADTLAGLGIAALVLWSAVDVIREAINGLMDSRMPDDAVAEIEQAIRRHPHVVGLHDLRTRRSGADKFVQVHVEMDGNMSFEAAHNVAEELTAKLERMLGRAAVTVHADPVEVDASGAIVNRPRLEPPALPHLEV